MNPYICGDSTRFLADSEPGDPIYFPVYTDGLKEHIERKLLIPPLKGARGNELTPRVKDLLIEKIRGVVEGLIWPIS